MFVEGLLATWSVIGLIWWIISWRLVAAASVPAEKPIPGLERKSLTVFKPLPPLQGQGLSIEARGLESFIAQLDATSEMLLGVHDDDAASVAPFVERMRQAHPDARIVVVHRGEPDTLANPKIAWQKLLAPHASGELWLWSDADIVAPPGFLNQARDEFAAGDAQMLTFPYAVRLLPHPAALLDALFVNAEFYPGVLFLRRGGEVDFGLGSGMLFSRESFLRRADWAELGRSLADDFMLGQLLQPVRLGSTTLETVADAKDWPAAIAHYFRWKKTVCWCRPIGFASQVIVMPLLGWMAWTLLHPLDLWAWVGLIGTIQMDVLFALLIFEEIGCSVSLESLHKLEAWSVGRIVFWVLCWLPGGVKWREKSWKESRVA